MADLIIKGGLVITMDGRFIENGVVVVNNGLITSVGKTSTEKADKIIDAGGCAVMPGLINAHTHLPMTLFRGYADGLSYDEWTRKIQAAEMKLTPKDVRTGAYLGVLEMIRSGTTAFADMYIHMDEVARVVNETGMRSVLGFGMIEGLNEETGIKLKSREVFSKKWNGTANGRITTMYAPHSAVSCSREFLIKVSELAAQNNTGIHIHVLETEDELNLMKKQYGMCSVNFLNDIRLLGPDILAAHCIWLSDDDIDILKEKEVNVVHCPVSNMNLGAGTAPVPRMLEKGINVALGTDGAASSGSLDMWKELKLAYSNHGAGGRGTITPERVLQMATANGARALKINAGILKPGRAADIILIDIKRTYFTSSNPVSTLVKNTSGCDVKSTIVNGRVLMEDQKLLELDEAKIIEEARETILKITE